MARRSLYASTAGIEKAKRAFQLTGWTQEYLATEVGLDTRQSIWKFFKGKSVARHIFMEICFRLNLEWEEIAQLPTVDKPDIQQAEQGYINALVQKVRDRRYDKIQYQCGTIRLLDIPQAIELNDIYISVNILETLSNQRWLEVLDLQDSPQKKFQRFGLGQIYQKRVPGWQAVRDYPKLMVLGKPGAGKSTFLQRIAIQCNQGNVQPNRIPIFIRLKKLSNHPINAKNFSLLHSICQELRGGNISEQEVESLLEEGRVFILLDGLDEVSGDASKEVVKQIRQLSEDYYQNHFIITCRLASNQYQIEGFTDVEVADFGHLDIENFAKKWFVAVGNNAESGLAKAERFMEKLQLPENQQIRELAVTPLLLNLACAVFQAKSDFPARRSDLYKQGLDVLLIRWDESRGVKRDRVYRDLSLLQKLKLLSQIAARTFEQGDYFFEQYKIVQYMANYLQNLPDSSSEPEELQVDSQAVLSAIISQHGLLVERAREIYSFSHLTFQEFLTAKNIVANPEPQILTNNLKNLVSHITEPRWREVFLLTGELLGNADELLQLMKLQIDEMMARDAQLQQFLHWLAQKSASEPVPYKCAATRALYLTLTLAQELNLPRDLNLATALDLSLGGDLATELKLDLALKRVLTLSMNLPHNPTIDRVLELGFALPMYCKLFGDPSQAKLFLLGESLQRLKWQIPNSNSGEILKAWWNSNRQSWTEELRTAMIKYRNIGYTWQFSDRQREILQQYYEANQFLVDFLNTNCQVTPAVRKQIQDTLLLPLEEEGNNNLSSFFLAVKV